VTDPFNGNTPLDPDEIEGLIPRHVTTQAELNQVEQANILEASAWALGQKHPKLLTDTYLKQLHKRMFGDVWKWAGTYRKSLKNIGVMPQTIPTEVRLLCEDTRHWMEHRTYDWIGIGARFHHRLVAIHPFPNGNGRHARMATDLLLATNDQNPFTWGRLDRTRTETQVRARYLAALKAADNHDLNPLLEFVGS